MEAWLVSPWLPAFFELATILLLERALEDPTFREGCSLWLPPWDLLRRLILWTRWLLVDIFILEIKDY